MKKYLIFPLFGILSILLASCPGTGPEIEGTLTGTVHDKASGLPVAGTTISFGSSSATTNGNGSFSLGLGATSGSVIDSLSIYKDGYNFLFLGAVVLDASSSNSVSLLVTPLDTSGYSTKTVSGTLTDRGGTPIAETTDYRGDVMTCTRGAGGFHAEVGTGGAYSIDTRAYSDDCLVVFSEPFQMMLKADLSGTSPIELNVQEPLLADYTSVNVNGVVGSSFQMMLGSPSYGGFGVSSGMPPTTVSVHNPYGYQAVWMVQKIDTTFTEYPGHARAHMAISDLESLTASMTLPSLDTSLGPDEPPDMISLAYSSPVLSIDAVAGATVYQYMLMDSGKWEGSILTFTSSISLPAWLTSRLAGKLIDVGFQVLDTNITGLGPAAIEAISLGGSPGDIKTGLIIRDLGGGSYEMSYTGQVQF